MPSPSSVACTRQIVCDNLKAGVTAACRYEPGINRTYQEMAAHYGTAIVPTRVRKPRDKAKVEVAVQVVERWVLARLRHRRFFSLGELNAAIRELIDELNSRTMRRIGSSRRALFEALERPRTAAAAGRALRLRRMEALPGRARLPRRGARTLVFRALPADPRGGRGAHHRPHGGAVPSRRPRRRACPQPDCGIGTPRSPEHMPSAHRRYADWTPARLLREAAAIGPATAALVELILHAKPHPEQGFRACLGILRLVRGYGAERVEAACQRGIDIGARTYGSIVSILRNNLDRAYRPQPVPDEPPVQHGNIRGGGYYH